MNSLALNWVWKIAVAYVLSAAVAYAVGSVAHSIFALAALNRVGAELSIGAWLQTIGHDLCTLAFSGKYVSYGATILKGFAVALPVAALIRKLTGLGRLLLYPLAGATAVAVLLYVIYINFHHLAMLAGTRGTAGVGCQLLAGALGGTVFAVLGKRWSLPW